MKNYLFGLGTMLVGAGLMFVLMHGEVSADSKPQVPEPFVCSTITSYLNQSGSEFKIGGVHCTTKKLDCAIGLGAKTVSCIKTGML